MFTRVFTRIVVGLDGSDHARKALAIAVGVAKNDKADLVLVRALSAGLMSKAERKLAAAEFGFKDLEPPMPAAMFGDPNADPRPKSAIAREETENAQFRARTEMVETFLEAARQEALEAGVANVEIRVEFGDPAKVILAVAERDKADLIVLGSRGLSNIEGLVYGSTSHKVSHLAKCSCVTVT